LQSRAKNVFSTYSIALEANYRTAVHATSIFPNAIVLACQPTCMATQ
jgi:hypothetical protein